MQGDCCTTICDILCLSSLKFFSIMKNSFVASLEFSENIDKYMSWISEYYTFKGIFDCAKVVTKLTNFVVKHNLTNNKFQEGV